MFATTTQISSRVPQILGRRAEVYLMASARVDRYGAGAFPVAGRQWYPFGTTLWIFKKNGGIMEAKVWVGGFY